MTPSRVRMMALPGYGGGGAVGGAGAEACTPYTLERLADTLAAAAPNGLNVECFPDADRDPIFANMYTDRATLKDGRVVATQADPKSEVNRGLNCVKGYFLSKIMYGHDRLTQPMLRKTNGQYDKNGEFTPVSWTEAFDIMAAKWKEALKADANYADAHYQLGMALLNEGKLPEAVASFESYVKLAPTGQYATQAKGMIAQLKK